MLIDSQDIGIGKYYDKDQAPLTTQFYHFISSPFEPQSMSLFQKSSTPNHGDREIMKFKSYRINQYVFLKIAMISYRRLWIQF